VRGLLLLAAQVDPKTLQPSIGVLEKTVIGSLLLLSWAIAILAIVQLIRVQNARVADQKEMSSKSEKLLDKMITAFEEMKGALQGLKEAEEKGHKVMETTQASMNTLSSRMDMLVFSVGGKRFTPARGMPSKPPIKEPESP
jgi:hypothetical protein